MIRADPPGSSRLAVPCGCPPPTGPLEPRLQHHLSSEQAGLDLSLLTTGDDHPGQPPEAMPAPSPGSTAHPPGRAASMLVTLSPCAGGTGGPSWAGMGPEWFQAYKATSSMGAA